LFKKIGQNRQCFNFGDFNLILADTDNTNVSNFIELMFENFYFPIINKPTRICKTNATVLDQIWTNTHSLPIKSGPILSPLSDHLPVYVCVNYNHIYKFNKELEKFDPTPFFSQTNPDLAYNLLMENYNQAFNNSFLLKTQKASKVNNPWFDQELAELMCQKDKLFKKYMVRKALSSKSQYNQARNLYYHTLKK